MFTRSLRLWRRAPDLYKKLRRYFFGERTHYRCGAIEKSYPQPDGRGSSGVGLTDFAIEPGKIVRPAGRFRLRQVDSARILRRSGPALIRSAFLAWQATERSSSERRDRFPELRPVSLALRFWKMWKLRWKRRGTRRNRAPQAGVAHAGIRWDSTVSKRRIPRNFLAA